MAESELAVLSTQCLERRIPNKPELTAEVAACVTRATSTAIPWKLTLAVSSV
jgi:hypothetical protein